MRTSWMMWLETKLRALVLGILLGAISINGCQPQNPRVGNVGKPSDLADDGERADGRPRWKTLRTITVGDVWSTSPNGQYIATIDNQRLRVTTTASGPVLHHVAIPIVANQLILTTNKAFCWKSLDPKSTLVAVLDIKSGKWSTIHADASIWNIAVDFSGKGIWMACGDHTVRHYSLNEPLGSADAKVVTDGYAEKITADPWGCVFTEVMPSGVTAVTNDATSRWHIDEENPKRVSRVFSTRSGALYLDSTERSKPDAHTITSISASTGAPIWEVQHTGRNVFAHADQKSGMLAVSVSTSVNKILSKLYVYRRDGSVIMDGRGSGYFTPTLVGLTESGHRITVLDGQRGLTTLSDSGSTLARRLPLSSVKPESLQGPFSRISTDDRYLFIQATKDSVLVLEALHEE